ncbi:MAG TPA: helix-turn-helix domain-containing protein [Flexivirga sp.]|uniref:PucR family transcriptional regulator n=1 Tax=Flexivirga sp. TaxID=1962927 RepID=UPI002BEC7625|nr:helix-turn-helix domain-containing protein [Flexivirga sp.]HWC24029.1 helix-turn-helix domain-containing protein [Flexivirga sp.]
MRSEQSVPGDAGLEIPKPVITTLTEMLPAVSERVVGAVIDSVPSYAGALADQMRETIEQAVQLALAGFLRLAAAGPRGDPSTPMQASVHGAYALGRGEARSGRSMDALLGAYRVGARVAWQDMSEVAVAAGLEAITLARFAELVFAYIDSLSAASVAGHAEELAVEGRVRERRRERLAGALLQGRTEETVLKLAERAEWAPPTTLTAVVLPGERVSAVTAQLGSGCLRAEDEPDREPPVAVLLVPDADGPGRRHLLRVLTGRPAYVGPVRPWLGVAASYSRALRAHDLRIARREPVDTDDHLARLVTGADPLAHKDLRAAVLAPLADLPPATADRLADTLRSWLLHQGRRDAVAAELHVHPQTVRYRMAQIREAYGERLSDPDVVRDLVIGLSVPSA